MKDLEIKAFGQRILAWTQKMQSLLDMSEMYFATKKHRKWREENDENQYEQRSDATGNNDGTI